MGPWFLFPFLGYLFVSCKFEKFQSDGTLNGNNWLVGLIFCFFVFVFVYNLLAPLHLWDRISLLFHFQAQCGVLDDLCWASYPLLLKFEVG